MAKTTQAQHTNQHGDYKKSRVKNVHNPIIEAALANTEPLNEQYTAQFIYIAGPPGSGKPKIYDSLLKKEVITPENTVVINRDLFKANTEFKTGEVARKKRPSHPEKGKKYVDEYYDIAEKIIHAAYEKNLNIVFMDHAEYPERTGNLLSDAKQHGCQTLFIASTLTEKQYHAYTQERISNRMGVNHKQRLNQYQVLAAHIDDYAQHADYTCVLQTDGKKPKVLAHYQQDQKTILNPRDWLTWQRQALLQVPDKKSNKVKPKKIWSKLPDIMPTDQTEHAEKPPKFTTWINELKQANDVPIPAL
jgi:adenylate kinase family enzyme